MKTLQDWQMNKEEWLRKDLELMAEEIGWKKRTENNGIPIFQRSFPDDKNDLFRWKLPKVAASFEEVHHVFTKQMIDYHHYWTAEYSGGFLVKEIGEHAQIVYQQFRSGIPLIANRDLLYVQWSKTLDNNRIQTSFRSIVMDDFPATPGFERIDWWGAHLFQANEDGSSQLTLIDRENQGGNFLSFMMNLIMPNYLAHQFNSILTFFEKGGTKTHAKLSDVQNTALKIKL